MGRLVLPVTDLADRFRIDDLVSTHHIYANRHVVTPTSVGVPKSARPSRTRPWRHPQRGERRWSGKDARALLAGLVVGAMACSRGGGGDGVGLSPPESPPQTATMCTPGTPRQAAALVKIDSVLGRWAEREAIPGLAAGIVCGGALTWSAGYGVHGIDDPTLITPATRFRIASITKLLTATAILQLRDAGALDLDAPVRRYLPWFRMKRTADVGDNPVTIRHLLTHTGGLPRNSRLPSPSRRFQPGHGEAITAQPGEVLEATPGTRYLFSNLGYGVLGEVIAAVTGLPYARVIRDSLLVPLGMTQTLVQTTPADTFLPTQPRGDSPSAPTIGFRDMGFAVSAGNLVSSVEDLSRFLVMQLAPYRGGNQVLLADSSVFAMHRVQFVRDSVGGGAGFGWRVDMSSNAHVARDGGEAPEQNAYLALDLPRGIGIILLTDVQGVHVEDPGAQILNILRDASGQ